MSDHQYCGHVLCDHDECFVYPDPEPKKPTLYGTGVRKGFSATNDMEPYASAWDTLVPVLCLVMSGGAFAMAGLALYMVVHI